MRISYNFVDSGQTGNFFGRSLGVASGDDDLAVGIFTMKFSDGGASILVGGSGHRTRIEDHNSGLMRRTRYLQTQLPELVFDCGAIRLRRPASKILDIEAGHGKMIPQSPGSDGGEKYEAFKWAGNQEAVTVPWLSAHSILSWIGGDTYMLGLIQWKSSDVYLDLRPTYKLELVQCPDLAGLQKNRDESEDPSRLI